MARELNFDGLVGPTHNYGGLAFGNLASSASEGSLSNPRAAALQGLDKMRLLYELGVAQAILPPHCRPDLSLARRLGFSGSDGEVLARVGAEAPLLLAACYSASSMWTANAATVSPSCDSADGKLHLTPANLQSQIHRSIEAPTTTRILRAIFCDPKRFVVHEPLPATGALGDEGAANHSRLCSSHAEPGIQLFVYGQSAANPFAPKPQLFPARQSLEASQSVARLHRLDPERVIFAQQNPAAIDLGVFHNDVIAVGDRELLLHHAEAFVDTPAVIDELRRRYARTCEGELTCVAVADADLPVASAVSTYLFNSQLVARPDGKRAIIAPKESEEDERAKAVIDALIGGEAPIDEAHFVELRESMRGGGGPACLRLRVVVTDEEWAALPESVIYGPGLHARLEAWIERHYRSELLPRDFGDPQLLDEVRVALDELTMLLGLGSIYPFQRR